MRRGQSAHSRTKGRPFDPSNFDADSSLSKRGLMQRKLYLMKLMLKNEKNANEAIKQRIGAIGRDLHADNYALYVRWRSTKRIHAEVFL